MNIRSKLWLAALLPLALGACSSIDTSKPILITTRTGMAVYTYTKDTENKSHCTGTCAVNWPPVRTEELDAGFPYGQLVRDDGSIQATKMGRPLYRWAKDEQPGVAAGHGRTDGAWQAAYR